ncbi:MAG: hypothetical protein J0L61_02545 [Planctomycetes bacterium]|nr:hypothetical protein [Planctomycetota bacterium]
MLISMLASVAVWLALVGAEPSPPSTTPFTATVLVKAPDGSPIPDAPVRLVSGFNLQVQMTDQQGIAAFEFQRTPIGFVLGAGLTPGYFAPVSPELQIHADARYEVLRQQYAFPTRTARQVGPDETSAHFEIAAKPAISVTGRLVDAAGGPYFNRGFAAVTYSHSITKLLPDAPFVCRGVPKSQAGRLVIAPAGSQIWVIDLTAAQLSADFDLGNVVVAPAPPTAGARLNSSFTAALFDAKWKVIHLSALLVRSDGQVVYNLTVHEDTRAMGPGLEPLDPGYRTALAPGTYYIAPGDIGSTVADKLLTLVRANRQVELDASNVPKFTAVEGQTVDFTLDPAAAKAIIEAIPEQPPVTGGP